MLLNAGIVSASAGGGTWTPADITTALWLDDGSDLTIESGGVSQWNDKSGNARHATATARPTSDTETLNDRRVITFNGSQRMALPSNIVAASGACIYQVVKFGNPGVDQYAVFAFNPRFYGPIRGNFSNTFSWQCNTLSTFHSITANTNPQIFGIRHEGSTAYALYNGAELATLSTTPTGNIADWALGGTTTQARLAGYIAEVIVLSSPTLEIRERIEGYLAHKWGLTANLPGGHPYKTVAP